MKIRVHLFAHLRKFSPTGEGRADLDLPPPARVADVLSALGLGPEVAAVVLVNGRAARPEEMLHPGDEVVIFPPVEGG